MRFAKLLVLVAVLGVACRSDTTLSSPSAGASAAASAVPATAATAAPAAAGTATAITLDCVASAAPLVELTEGPYYKAGPPQRTSLMQSGLAGTPLTLTGAVVTRSCRPLANAKLDFWQADGNGNYDNSGYTLRGWQLTDAQGQYRLETVIPGLYPGRTEHIHVKVTPAGGQTYTTQLFFPGVAQNTSDSIYSGAMLVKLDRSTNPIAATFLFVVNLP